MDSHFTNWIKWDKRDSLSGILYPGVYCIAITNSDISEDPFSWLKQIKYIGMTNSKNGLKGRLKQFDYTIRGKKSVHGGADRFRYRHEDYDQLIEKLFVAVRSFPCDVNSNKPPDLRIMGEVAKFEYDCFALYVEKYGKLPEFNDKPNSPKYSRLKE